MQADFTIKIEFEAEAQGRTEIVALVSELMNRFAPILDDLCGEDDWAFDWTADYSRAMAKHNKEIEDAKPD